MAKLPAMINRHVLGASAIFAGLIILGYAANIKTNRPVASLPEANLATSDASSSNMAWTGDILERFKQVPANAYGSARGLEGSQQTDQRNKSGIGALLPTWGAGSGAKGWSEEDWQIATKAVSEHHASAKDKPMNASALANLVWQPPEEIAHRKAEPSRQPPAR